MGTTNKIKIMHVAECVGGVDKYLRFLLRYMDHDRYENIVVLSQLYRVDDYAVLADYVEVLQMKHGIGLKTLTTVKEIRKLIKQYNPDVVYAHSSIAGAVTRLANIGLKTKCIYNPHGWAFNMQSKWQWVFVVLEKIMSHFCDRIICISEAEKKSALDKKICNEQKLRVIFSGIETDLAPAKTRTELGIPQDAFVIGMVGRICKQKAPDTFIKMASIVNSLCPDTYCVIVGDVLEGNIEERKEIEDLAARCGVRLHLTGWVENAIDYIGTFDVACLLSRWEGFGLVLPEYMLCGKPIVASRVDAIPYLIKEGYNGLLVDVDDYQGAAKAVVAIRQDKELRERLICNGLKEVHEKYDARRMTEEHCKFFDDLVK